MTAALNMRKVAGERWRRPALCAHREVYLLVEKQAVETPAVVGHREDGIPTGEWRH